MNRRLEDWNALPPSEAAKTILSCCGSEAWARELAARRPFRDGETLAAASDAVWRALLEADWREAFDSHPRIGESHAHKAATGESLRWSAAEQRAAIESGDATKQALVQANRRYEAKFDRIFIVCASGRSTAEILAMLEARMNNDPTTELREAAEQQRQITRLRLRRWLEGT